ncbi:hypothetical protein P0D73_27855 [Paraburkholderia sp. RL18-101-BIB-B]|uniref:hypothetical protein n=1 Tax=Paraburkholderia sp. RL18-101-BIB-B TaxID=3031634 RepID=UPI0038B82BD2
MAFYFEPVALDATQEGHYLLFELLGPLLGQKSRIVHLDQIKARLLYRLAAHLAGGPSPTGIARRFCGEEDVGTVRKRYARLRDYASSFDSSEKRKNGIVSICLEHLSRHTSLVATLFDAPIWEIVSRDCWPLRELEAVRNTVESMDVEIPADPTDEYSASCFYFSLCQPGFHCTSTAWAAANLTAFCLARAQAKGDLVTYGIAYDAMIFHARESQKPQGDDVVTLTMRDFWVMFVRFVRLWHSRVKVTDLHGYDRARLAKSLDARTVEAHWQIIPPAALRQEAVLPKVVTRGESHLIYSEQSARGHRWVGVKRLWRIPRWRSRFFMPKPARRISRDAVRYRGINVEFDEQTFSLVAERSEQIC